MASLKADARAGGQTGGQEPPPLNVAELIPTVGVHWFHLTLIGLVLVLLGAMYLGLAPAIYLLPLVVIFVVMEVLVVVVMMNVDFGEADKKAQ